MRRAFHCFTQAVVLAAATCALAGPTTQELRTQAKQRLDMMAQQRVIQWNGWGAPAIELEQTRIEEIFRFRIIDGMIAVESPLNSPINYQRVGLLDDPITDVLIVLINTTPPGQWGAPAHFQFQAQQIPSPNGGSHSINMYCNQGQVSINCAGMRGQAQTQMTFNQSPATVGFNPSQVNFTVYEFQPGKQAQPKQMVAPDLEMLRIEHGDDVDEYLRPVLRELHQESVLGVSYRALQVFGSAIKADDKAVAALKSRLGDLNSEDSAIRNHTYAELYEMGPRAARAIAEVDVSNVGVEARSRLEELQIRYRQLSEVEVKSFGDDARFMIACLNCDPVEVRTAALEALNAKFKKTFSFDVNASVEARTVAVQQLRKGLLAEKK
jgi:hypothetical protein